MARPKKPVDELKDQRVPIMMSEDELKAIDDWRFANRIASRGEAIRRLCQIGLKTDEAIEPVWAEVKGNAHRRFADSDGFLDLLEKRSLFLLSKWKVLKFTGAMNKAMLNDAVNLMRPVEHLRSEIKSIKGAPDVTEDPVPDLEASATLLEEAVERLKEDESLRD